MKTWSWLYRRIWHPWRLDLSYRYRTTPGPSSSTASFPVDVKLVGWTLGLKAAVIRSQTVLQPWVREDVCCCPSPAVYRETVSFLKVAIRATNQLECFSSLRRTLYSTGFWTFPVQRVFFLHVFPVGPSEENLLLMSYFFYFHSLFLSH